jgi:hypothetical protein
MRVCLVRVPLGAGMGTKTTDLLLPIGWGGQMRVELLPLVLLPIIAMFSIAPVPP